MNRSADWFAQACRDLDQVRDSQAAGRHERICFAAQQAAEKAVKALHLALGQEAFGHVIATLLKELPIPVPSALVDKAKVLDNFYIATRYADGHPAVRRSSTTGRCKAEMPCAMPVRSLNSSVLRWPDARAVEAALQHWAKTTAQTHPEVLRIGYFGSYARGDWGWAVTWMW